MNRLRRHVRSCAILAYASCVEVKLAGVAGGGKGEPGGAAKDKVDRVELAQTSHALMQVSVERCLIFLRCGCCPQTPTPKESLSLPRANLVLPSHPPTLAVPLAPWNLKAGNRCFEKRPSRPASLQGRLRPFAEYPVVSLGIMKWIHAQVSTEAFCSTPRFLSDAPMFLKLCKHTVDDHPPQRPEVFEVS